MDLSAQGLKARPYHAGLGSSVRRRNQEKFINDQIPIIAATIAFGMGIDKPDIRLIVHYALPKTLEGYYQETGRAGRDDLPSECVLFYSFGDKYKYDFFINQIEDGVERENARQKLAQVIEFCELRTCRRNHLLSYFGEAWSRDNCESCDVCLTVKTNFEATEIAQKNLSTVVRTGQRFGVNHVSQVLRGARTKKVRELEHDKLTVYGIAQDFTDDGIKEIVGHLLSRGLLAKNGTEYPTLAITQDGWTFLMERQSLTLSMPKRDREIAPIRDAKALDYDQKLFDKLRDLRRTIASRRGVPPYVIFGDATLQQMAFYFTQSRESFSRISGVGAVKLEEFGVLFMSVIRQHARLFDLSERDLPTHRIERPRSVQRAGSTIDETKKLFYRDGEAWTPIATVEYGEDFVRIVPRAAGS